MIIKCDKPNCGSTNVEFDKAESIQPFGAITAAQASEKKEIRRYICRTCKFEFSIIANQKDPYESTEIEQPKQSLSPEELNEALKVLAPPSSISEPVINYKLKSPTAKEATEKSEKIIEEAGVNPICFGCGQGRYQYNGTRHNTVPPTFQFQCTSCGIRASLEPNYR